MKVEDCSNCGRVIGKLEQAYVFRGNVVCPDCYRKLSNTKDKQGQAAIKKAIAVVIALFVLTVSLYYLVNYIDKKDQFFQPLSENDVRLIEAFIHEMNLLTEIKLSDHDAYKAQLAKLGSAHKDITSFGSSDNSMNKMSNLAFNVWFNYNMAYSFLELKDFGKYKELDKEASLARDELIKEFRSLRGLESEQKDEATSK